MKKEKIIKWLKNGSVIYYFQSGEVAIVNFRLEEELDLKINESLKYIDFSIFAELRKEEVIEMTGKGGYTLFRHNKYQSYTMVE